MATQKYSSIFVLGLKNLHHLSQHGCNPEKFSQFMKERWFFVCYAGWWRRASVGSKSSSGLVESCSWRDLGSDTAASGLATPRPSTGMGDGGTPPASPSSSSSTALPCSSPSSRVSGHRENHQLESERTASPRGGGGFVWLG